MEKPVGRHYRYDSYHQQQQTHQQKNNSKTASLKRNQQLNQNQDRNGRCLCFGKNDGGYAQGVFSNLGICALLVGYTLLGSFVFLAIEGGGSGGNSPYPRSSTSYTAVNSNVDNQRRPATQNSSQETAISTSSWLKRVADESRARTVENIWDITVSLNILYRDNWTRLAAQEISRFQDQLVQRLTEEMAMQQHGMMASGASGSGGSRDQNVQERRSPSSPYEWNFARAFLYSLTVLTTIGYGNIAPRTALGKAVTMGYAVFGIPLMLIYLSSVGSLLSRCVRGVFSRAVCCCFCSNCGYCCYDEKRMQDKERRMKKKRQQMELQQQQQQLQIQEPFYVRSSSSVTAFTTSASSTHNNLHSPVRDGEVLKLQQSSSILGETDYGTDSLDNDRKSLSQQYHSTGSILAPVVLCLCIMVCYICGGAVVLTKLEAWTFLDGSYFCFMSLSTIGFGDLVPGGMASHHMANRNSSGRALGGFGSGNGTVWFCSLYILSGMALTAMCFNILHDEIVHRLKHHVRHSFHHDKDSSSKGSNNFLEDANGGDPYSTSS